jgi:Fe-S cluster biogenesis protein NfuA
VVKRRGTFNPMGQPDDAVLQCLERVLGPLVRGDGGSLYVVEATPQRVVLHLGGRFSGCPGNALVTRRLITPLVQRVAPGAQVTVTSGQLLPSGARLIGAGG